MKRNNIFLIILISLMCLSLSKTVAYKERHILFIGNSLTYYADMPQILQAMLHETHPRICIHQITYSGMSLDAHVNEMITESSSLYTISTRNKKEGEQTETEKKIMERKWDVIVLQSGTIGFLIPENRELKINKAVETIKQCHSNPNCEYILFYTWPSTIEYPVTYCYPSGIINDTISKDQCCSPTIHNVDEYINMINESYDQVAYQYNLKKSYNGIAFYKTWKDYPEIELLTDYVHPNENGAFLNACIFYQLLTDKKATDLHYTGSIEKSIAEKLKKIASENKG